MTLEDDPVLVAAMDVVRRTGAAAADLSICAESDPPVYFATVRWRMGRDGVPRPAGEINAWEVAAGRTPREAALRLAERVVDGGVCVHCERPAMFEADLDFARRPGSFVEAVLDPLCCHWQWDPELAVFRRSCEGEEHGG